MPLPMRWADQVSELTVRAAVLTRIEVAGWAPSAGAAQWELRNLEIHAKSCLSLMLFDMDGGADGERRLFAGGGEKRTAAELLAAPVERGALEAALVPGADGVEVTDTASPGGSPPSDLHGLADDPHASRHTWRHVWPGLGSRMAVCGCWTAVGFRAGLWVVHWPLSMR